MGALAVRRNFVVAAAVCTAVISISSSRPVGNAKHPHEATIDSHGAQDATIDLDPRSHEAAVVALHRSRTAHKKLPEFASSWLTNISHSLMHLEIDQDDEKTKESSLEEDEKTKEKPSHQDKKEKPHPHHPKDMEEKAEEEEKHGGEKERGGTPRLARRWKRLNQHRNNIYNMIDLDGNGQISKEEFKESLVDPDKDMEKFDEIDEDHSGFIDEKEFKKAFEGTTDIGAKFSTDMFIYDAVMTNLFDAIDTSKNGLIDKEEFEKALLKPDGHKGLFEKIAVDADGKPKTEIDEAELLGAMEWHDDKPPLVTKRMFKVGKNIMGRGDESEEEAKESQGGTTGPVLGSCVLLILMIAARVQ